MKPKPLGQSIGWITRSAKYIFESKWFRLRQDQVSLRGQEMIFTYLEHPGSVFVVPVTPDKRIVLIRCYRYNVDQWVWQLPAGGLGDKRDVPLEQAARAELAEETGYTGGTFEKLSTFVTGVGVMDLEKTFFLARGVERASEQNLEDTEEIDRVALFTVAEAVAMAKSGEIKDGESALGVLIAAERI